MDKVFSKLNEDEVKTLVKYMKRVEIVVFGGVIETQPPPSNWTDQPRTWAGRIDLRIPW